ncbi:hypothetical protein V7S43_016197 [Phytophthora oleae]|uniref:Transmembrane protein n=1 Tax=Phytophthora oleae TaxID=2107226 RepID=A0ABD3EXM6_9STRA
MVTEVWFHFNIMVRQVVIPSSAQVEGDAGSDQEGKKDGAYWSRLLVVPSRSRQVSRFWLEKALVLTDGVQIFALMWQLSQPWPWPARWLEATRWTNVFTLDLFSFRATGAAMGSTSQSFSLWGEMRGYWLYALMYALVPWTGELVLYLANKSWTKQGRSDYLLLKVTWENVLLQILQFLYVPVGLSVLRLVNCSADGGVSVDPTGMSCGSAGHVMAVLVIVCGLGGGFLVGLPWRLHRRIRAALVHRSVEKHERFVQGKELEFMLGTSDVYLELYMPQFSSFRRHSVEMPVQVCLLKLALIFTFSLLRSQPPSMVNQGVQGSIFFFVVVSMAVYKTWRFPYRCVSTSYLAVLVDWMLIANGVFVLLCANGVRSALTVSTSVTSSLTFLNSVFLVVIGLTGLRDMVLIGLYPEVANVRGLFWPTNGQMKEIVDYGPKLANWVKAIHDAQSIILGSLLVIPSMRSCEDLKVALEQTESCCEEAATTDHLLTVVYAAFIFVGQVANSF